MKKTSVLLISLLVLFFAASAWASGSQEKAEAKESVTVRIVFYGGYGYDDMMEKKQSSFEADNPGIRIDPIFIPYNQLREKLTMALSEETGEYDIVHSGTGWESVYYKFFENLDPYIERDDFNLDDFVQTTVASIGVIFSDEDERYGLPYRAHGMGFWYRKDIMDKIGMDPSSWLGMPGWDSYLAACEKLEGTDLITYPSVLSGMHMVPIILFEGTYLPSGKLWFNSKGEPMFKNEAGIRGAEIIKEIYSYGPEGAASLERPEAAQIFLAGDAALHMTWANFVTSKLEDPDSSRIAGKWGATNNPGPTNIGSCGMYMVGASKNKDAAWEVIKWLASKEMMAQAMIDTGVTHTHVPAYAEPGVSDAIPDLAAQLETLMRAFMLGMNAFPKGGAWIHEAGKFFVEYVWGDKTAEETLDRIIDSWYKHNGEAVGKTKWLTYYEQHGLEPPNWRPSEEKIRKAVDSIK